MASAIEAFEAACKFRDDLKKQQQEKTQRMLRVLQALQTDPPSVSIISAPSDYSHFELMFKDGSTFHSANWPTAQELATMMAAIPVAEKATSDAYNAMSDAEKRNIAYR
jgi:hypothetical protein